MYRKASVDHGDSDPIYRKSIKMNTASARTSLYKASIVSLIQKCQRIGDQNQLSSNEVIRVDVPFPKIDTLLWINQQKSDEKWFWRCPKSGDEYGGVGTADFIEIDDQCITEKSVAHITQKLTKCDDTSRYFGAIPFDDKLGHWKNLQLNGFYLPLIQIKKTKEFAILSCHLLKSEDISTDTFLNQLNKKLNALKEAEGLGANTFSVKSRSDLPTQSEWSSLINQAQQKMKESKLTKLVLSRQTTFTCEKNINPSTLFKQMMPYSDDCYGFMFQHKEGSFLGLSPEMLYKKEVNQIETMALAGTRPRGLNEIQDRKLENDLLSSAKDNEEQGVVCKMLEKELKELCTTYRYTEKKVLKLATVQHLCHKIKGTLKESSTNSKILNRIHPTPAISGYPVKLSKEIIKKLESFNRGFYAGVVGYLSRENSEFSVAIRSAYIHENKCIAYTGAGILSQSKADYEWQELEVKLQPFLKTLSPQYVSSTSI